MTARPTLACDFQRLRLLLADQLPPDQSTELTEHLSDCGACRQALERLAADPEWWAEVGVSFRENSTLVGPPEMTQPLVETAGEEAPTDLDLESCEESFTDESWRQFLDPCDEPGTMGRLGEYEILEVIGRGGMSVVLKAYHRELSRSVAIKVMAFHLASSPTARQRFNREARAAAAILHPNVMPIFSVCITAPLPYLVMPLVCCESLQQRIDRQGPLDCCEILRIGMQVARGLAAAHAQGLVHRDVKPANVLLEKPANVLLEKGVERVLLTDFGLALAADDLALTRDGQVAGTPQYMSPEQAQSQPVDARSDLFSLGSVIYVMATGINPFPGETAPAILRNICDTIPIPIRKVTPLVPTWLERIVATLHCKDPAARYQTAEEVADLLERCLAHLQQPNVTPLPNALRDVTPPVSTRVAWGLLSLLVLLGSLAGWGLWLNRREPKGASVSVNELASRQAVSAEEALESAAAGAGAVPEELEPEPPRSLNGPVIIDFHSSRTGGIPDGQSGVFYDDRLQLADCHIDALPIQVTLPGNRGTVGMLALLYNLRGEGVYNGWYIKPLADWSPYARGELILILRRLDPQADTYHRTIGLDTRETECLRQFKVELKVADGEGSVVTIGRPQFIDDNMLKQQIEAGFFELRIPLDGFASDLARVHELVLVFDNQFAVEQAQGGLAVGAVVLTPTVGERLSAAPGWCRDCGP